MDNADLNQVLKQKYRVLTRCFGEQKTFWFFHATILLEIGDGEGTPNSSLTRVGTSEVCVLTHDALRMSGARQPIAFSGQQKR